VHPADLGGAVLDALVERTGIDPTAIEDVIVGCVSQAGEQAFAFGRNLVLASKLPDSVPAVTIDRQCGSSQQALHFAAQAVLSIGQMMGDEMDHFALPLDAAADGNHIGREYDAALLLKHLLPNDQIGYLTNNYRQ
jgi:hypothetical protein